MNRAVPCSALLLALCATSCATGRGPPESEREPDPQKASIPAAREVLIMRHYTGFLHLTGDSLYGPYHTEPRALRDQAAYDAFVDAIPKRKMSARADAPPSTDPLLQRPPIDFAKHMLVVVLRDSIYGHTTITGVSQADGRLVIEVEQPPLPEHHDEMARPLSVGRYAAVVVARSTSALEVQSAIKTGGE